MIFSDPFYQTLQGEIYLKSNCLQHEHAIRDILASLLQNLGYLETALFKRQWTRIQKKDFNQTDQHAVVCLADNFGVCSGFIDRPENWFNKDTVVITDNQVAFDPQYKIFQLPSSYFGIFNYVPDLLEFNPTRRFGLSVNRFDHQRQEILLELLNQSGGIDHVLTNDYVNFNVRDPVLNNVSDSTLEKTRRFFSTAWQSNQSARYQKYYQQALDQVPIKNHSHSVEQAHVNVYLNLVIETYSDDLVIALSEKIFRALVTPAPWTVYSAANTVKYLKDLGFDVLDDIVNHSYDAQQHLTTSDGNEKIIKYISSSIAAYHHIKNTPLNQLTARCQHAAHHNQTLLSCMQRRWPADFATWLPTVIEQIQ